MSQKEKSFAEVVVERVGLRGLYQVVDLVLLWSVASGAGRKFRTLDQVREFAISTGWGSRAKFYRHLERFRKATGVEHPGVLLVNVRLSKDRNRAAGELLTASSARLGVI